MKVDTLESLPQVIKGAGSYLTRNGDRVAIYSLNSDKFGARGTIFRQVKGKVRAEHNCWHFSGRVLEVGTHADDLVSVVELTPV